ncbi:MAG: PD-(D/E)XK nuclease family protein, partial [Planctomycetota bacterium]
MQVNRIRIKTGRPLFELKEKLSPPDNQAGAIGAGQFTQAIFDFLDVLGVAETVGSWIEQANQKNDRAAADEHQQFYNKYVDVFDELVEVFVGRTMTAEDYFAIINSAFSQLTLAFIPPTLDQVLVGSIERSRHPDLRAVFLIGATQRQFPVPLSSDSILTDDDRIAAESADFQLAATSGQILAERQYLAYIAFARSSEFLCVTYPSVDDKGGAVPRSQFIGDLESLFQDLNEESIAREQMDVEKVLSRAELADLLCSGLGRDNLLSDVDDNGGLDDLLDGICSDGQLAELGSNVLSALDYDNGAQLEGDVVDKLFGRRIRSSATRLSAFAACPYQHFARYTLGLKERDEFKFEPLDLGRFYHRVLDALLKRLNAEATDFAVVDNKELVRLLGEEIEKLIKEDSFISNFVNRRGYNEFIMNSAGESLEDCVLAISQMVRAGSFRPRLSEVSFGQVKDARDTLGECEFALGGNRVLSLDGKIDRLDVADVDGEETAVVFDYKRRDTSFGWSKFYHGLDMQLPIYMLAIRNAAGPPTRNVAGAFYMPVEAGPARTTLADLSKKTESFDYKAKGIFNGRFFGQLDRTAESGWSRFYSFRLTAKDQQYGNYAISGVLKPNDFEGLLQFAGQKIVQLTEQIASGEINARPYRLNQTSPC